MGPAGDEHCGEGAQREQPLRAEAGKGLREQVKRSRGPGGSGPRSWQEGPEQRRVGKGFEFG